MRIAFCGHSYHRTTRSSGFLLEELRRRGDVEEFWDEGWLTGVPLDATPVVHGGYDAVVVWQVGEIAKEMARSGHPNVTFFPMYDGCYWHTDRYWHQLIGLKLVCFSSTLHERVQRLGVRSRFVRFYPDPAGLPRASGDPELAGFFWQRQQDITWATIRSLLGADFRRFTLHSAADPSFGAFVPPSEEDVRRHRIRVTSWFPTRQAAVDDLVRHNVYFAPRLREGIGMSFLEAMAMGFLVVAPDQPTMNEYIVSGVNGLLYDPVHPRPLDFSRREEMGARARRSVELGWRKWRRSLPALLDFTLTPTAEHPALAPVHAFDPLAVEGGTGPRVRLPKPTAAAAEPFVTVAVVTRNAEATLATTLDSILAQDAGPLEVIVLDRASTDRTLDVVRGYGTAVNHRKSEAAGRYEAMNEAARVANGAFVLFMDPGDRFHTTDALSLATDGMPHDADVIFGHHIHRDVHGYEVLRPAADFGETHTNLSAGTWSWRWQSGVPAHPATLIRARLLREHPYRTDLRIAADDELLYRLAKLGCRFRHSMVIIARCDGGNPARDSRSRYEEWRRIALEHSEQPAAIDSALQKMRAEMLRSALPEVTTWELLLHLGRMPGATRELKRRFRTARALRDGSSQNFTRRPSSPG